MMSVTIVDTTGYHWDYLGMREDGRLVGEAQPKGRPLCRPVLRTLDDAVIAYVARGARKFTPEEFRQECALLAAIIGYIVVGPGLSTGIHQRREVAEAEAVRLASANTGTTYFVKPITAQAVVSAAFVPKPQATLEKYDA